MGSLVCLQVTGLGERSVTNGAGEELFSSMGCDFKLEEHENDFGQILQSKGISPE